MLVDYFLNCDRHLETPAAFSEKLLQIFIAHNWPGNVRELRNVIERMRLLNSDKTYYNPADAPVFNESRPILPEPTKVTDISTDIDSIKTYLSADSSPRKRRERLIEIFQRFSSLKVYQAAEILGVSRSTASRDLQHLEKEGIVRRICPTRSSRSDYYELLSQAYESDNN